MLSFPWTRLHHRPITLGSSFSALAPAAAWLLLCAILHSPAALLPVTSLLLLGLVESQGSFYLFRTACWRHLRWLPRCHWKGREKKKNWIQSRLYWEIQLYCYIAVRNTMYYHAAEVYSEQSNQTTQIHRTLSFTIPFCLGNHKQIQLSNSSFPASQWLL